MSISSIVGTLCLLLSSAYSFHNRVLHNNRITQLNEAKFDPQNFIEVSLKKPLGIVLQEVKENAKEVRNTIAARDFFLNLTKKVDK
jgi:hypothetical protein